MPIKLPKGFQRRKSSGNALDEVRNPPAGDSSTSSFRVLERPASKGKSFDGGLTMKLGSQESPRPPPKDYFHHQEEDIFTGARHDASNRYVMYSNLQHFRLSNLRRLTGCRGSGGTERSHSTAPNDSAASSARLSTSSTNPSSIDTRSDKANGQRPYNDIPVPPPSSARPGFLRDSSRTFSFGMAKRSSPASSPGGLPPLINNKRDRAVTASTASTATPPRLFDSDLALENSEMDGFGNMFDHIGSSSQSQGIRLIQSEVDLAFLSFLPHTNLVHLGACIPLDKLSTH